MRCCASPIAGGKMLLHVFPSPQTPASDFFPRWKEPTPDPIFNGAFPTADVLRERRQVHNWGWVG